MSRGSTPHVPETSQRAHVVAAGAGCLWFVLAGFLALLGLTAAAVGIPAFVVLAPWALVALGLAIVLIAGRPRRRILVGSALLGILSAGLGITSLFGSTEDFQAASIAFTCLSVAAVAYSLLALWRLPGATPV